jgi:hypothetical protein
MISLLHEQIRHCIAFGRERYFDGPQERLAAISREWTSGDKWVDRSGRPTSKAESTRYSWSKEIQMSLG